MLCLPPITPQVVTQASLILLLYGTMCGGLAFLSDVARIMVLKGLPGQAPELLERDGRPVMIVVVLLVLFPLCLQVGTALLDGDLGCFWGGTSGQTPGQACVLGADARPGADTCP